MASGSVMLAVNGGVVKPTVPSMIAPAATNGVPSLARTIVPTRLTVTPTSAGNPGSGVMNRLGPLLRKLPSKRKENSGVMPIGVPVDP